MKLVALYSSKGDVGAFLRYPNLYNPAGEWIGFVTVEREVYSVLGNYIGYVSDDRRILRDRTPASPKPHLVPPAAPPKALPPATVPLAPLMREITHSTVDVLLEEPERLHTLDIGEFRTDME